MNEKDTGMLFDRNDLTAGGTKTRRRGVSTSYGNRRPNQFKTLSNVPTNTANHIPPLSFGVNSNNNFDVASGNTLFLSSPTSVENNATSDLNLNGHNIRHTNPTVG